MKKDEQIKIYLDHCMYMRPFDSQVNFRIMQEAQAKLRIQHLITQGKFILVASYMNEHENNRSVREGPRLHVKNFITNNALIRVGDEFEEDIKNIAEKFVKQGLKPKDAAHLACAIFTECTYIITTDDRFLRFNDKTKSITILDPNTFIRLEDHYE